MCYINGNAALQQHLPLSRSTPRCRGLQHPTDPRLSPEYCWASFLSRTHLKIRCAPPVLFDPPVSAAPCLVARLRATPSILLPHAASSLARFAHGSGRSAHEYCVAADLYQTTYQMIIRTNRRKFLRWKVDVPKPNLQYKLIWNNSEGSSEDKGRTAAAAWGFFGTVLRSRENTTELTRCRRSEPPAPPATAARELAPGGVRLNRTASKRAAGDG